MIAPNMATMFGFIFTDANISQEVLNKMLKRNTENTFNAITVDGDTSTNDMVLVFSTRKAKNRIINDINSKSAKDTKFICCRACLNLNFLWSES